MDTRPVRSVEVVVVVTLTPADPDDVPSMQQISDELPSSGDVNMSRFDQLAAALGTQYTGMGIESAHAHYIISPQED
jgi:hypothetical protein